MDSFAGILIVSVADRHPELRRLQPILSSSPKSVPTHLNSRLSTVESKPMVHIDHNFTHLTARKEKTWTRSTKGSCARTTLSPIQIPTFFDPSVNHATDHRSMPLNDLDDDDEFERYSPTPPSTPRHQSPPYNDQRFFPRPITYKKSKRINLNPSKIDQEIK